MTQGTLKRHAGGYSWESIIGATGGKIGFYSVTPITQPAGAEQAAVTLGNVDGEIAALTISDPPTRAEVQALRDKCEELADDVRALATPSFTHKGGARRAGRGEGRGVGAPHSDRSAQPHFRYSQDDLLTEGTKPQKRGRGSPLDRIDCVNAPATFID